MFKEREIYTATKGVENEGYDFEVAMLCFYCLHLCYNEDIKDFKIAIYDDKYHPFDDIVIDISNHTTEKYAIQLKHVKEKLVLNSNHFSKNGKMVLTKYFKFDFAKSHHVVLLTNGVLNEEISVGTCHIKVKTKVTQMEKNLDTSSEDESHIYEIYDEGTSNKITFYTSQKNRCDIDKSMKEKLSERFCLNEKSAEVALHKLKAFFQQWKKGSFGLSKLDRQDIKMKIAEILLQDHIVEYQPTYTSVIPETVVLLKDVLNSFNVTIARNVKESDIQNLCYSDLGYEKLLEVGENYLIIPHEGLSKEMVTILWRLKKFPLVLAIDDNNKKMICQIIDDLLNENLSFILLGDVDRSDLANIRTFENLRDLENRNEFENITKQFQVSIQGQERVSLQELIKINSKFQDIFSVKELIAIATEEFIVGGNEDSLPQIYIPRRILTMMIKISAVKQFPKDLFVIIGSCDILKKKLPQCKFWTLEEYNQKISLGDPLVPKSIVVGDVDSKDETKFFATCLKYKNSNVHCLKLIDEETLELKYSKKKSEKLQKFQVFPENELHKLLKNNINLICARPGMGKMILMRYLKRNCPPGFWTIKVDLQENDQEFFRKDSSFLSKVRDCFREVRRVMFFFYGIDNLQKNNLIKAIKMIKQLADDDYKVWIFSEDHLKDILEKNFEVSSMDIEEFNEEEQRSYIKERIKDEKMYQNLRRVLGNLKIFESNDILGIPMYLFMLTEIFINNIIAEVEEIFTLNNIYQYFIRTKFSHYLDRKSLEEQNQMIRDGIYYRTEQYKIAAISSLDPAYFSFHIHCDHFFLTQISKVGDVIGIISKISDDGNIIFSQQTCADYFAALWLADNFKKVDMKKFIFREEFRNIFFMFNLEICKNHPAHIAVLYQNFKQLQKYKHELGGVDRLGRLTMHLACSLGGKYPKLDHDGNLIKTDSVESVKEDKDMRKILDYLIEQIDFDPLQKDKIFKWDLLDCAFNSLNLYAIESILSKYPETYDSVLKKLPNFESDLFTIIYYSVKYGYENLVDLVSTTNMFSEALSKENSSGESLLHLAAKSGNSSIVRILLEKGAKVDIFTSTHKKRSPLHFAVENDHYEAVKILLENGASVDIMDRYRNTPLHLASIKGASKSVEVLLEHDSDVNFADNFGRTPLHLAATHGYINIVKQLLKEDVNIDKCDRLGNRPINCAKDRQIIELLSKKGAKMNIGKIGKLPSNEFDEYITHQLHHVCFTDQPERIDSLIQDGYSVNEKDSFGRTPLYRAVENNNLNIVDKLIDKDADLNIPDNNGVVPVCRAINDDNYEMANLLLKNDASIDVKDNYGYTPLHWAATIGNNDIVKLLLSKNPDIEATDFFGRKPVDIAIENGFYKIVKSLDDDISKFNLAKSRSRFLSHYQIRDDDQTSSLTPFQEAIRSANLSLVRKFLKQGRNKQEIDHSLFMVVSKMKSIGEYMKIIELLLEEGGYVNTTDECRSTILHWSVLHDNIDIVKLLIRYNAPMNFVDIFDYSALDVAVMLGHSEILSVLIQHGGNINRTDDHGNTPLDWACKKGHINCVEVLLRNQAIARTMQEDYLNMAKRQFKFLHTKKTVFKSL